MFDNKHVVKALHPYMWSRLFHNSRLLRIADLRGMRETTYSRIYLQGSPVIQYMRNITTSLRMANFASLSVPSFHSARKTGEEGNNKKIRIGSSIQEYV